ncbi:MAG TPA: hypothetical protein DCW29_04945 [Janthinobacterium sp.]|nr:hypothetical protein [Janthinobacterium sp.]
MKLAWVAENKLFTPDVPARLNLGAAKIINDAIDLQTTSGTLAAAAYLQRNDIPLATSLRVLVQGCRRQPAQLFMYSRLRPRPPASAQNPAQNP